MSNLDEASVNTPYERGLEKTKPLMVSDDGFCLSELSMTFLANHRKRDKIPKKVGHVKDICGTTRRLLLKLWVHNKSTIEQYWVDDITGTMYQESGECMSSEKRKVVKWVRYRPSEWNKRQQAASHENPFEWNEGV